jgi:hypothetical protein
MRNRMIRSLSLKVILLAIACGWGQTFHIKDYQIPEHTRQELKLHLDAYTHQELRPRSYGASQGDFAPKASVEYKRNRHHDDYDYRQQWNFSSKTNHTWSNVNHEGYEWKMHAGMQGDVYSWFKPQKWHLASTYKLNYLYTQRKYTQNNYTGYYHTLQAKGSFGFGYGRLLEVQDARNAQLMFDELVEAGVLFPARRAVDIKALADLMAVMRKARVWDSRLERIENLTQIHSFFDDRGYVRYANAKYFYTIADNWDYGALQQRLSGHLLSFNLIPAYTVFVNDERNTSELYGEVAFRKEAPLNLKWQQSFHTRLVAGWSQVNKRHPLDPVELRDYDPMITSDLRYGLSYYPNTRTDWHMEWNGNWRKDYREYGAPESGLAQVAHGFSVQQNMRGYWYINPQMKLLVMGYIGYSYASYAGEMYTSEFSNPAFAEHGNNLYMQSNKKELMGGFSIAWFYNIL